MRPKQTSFTWTKSLGKFYFPTSNRFDVALKDLLHETSCFKFSCLSFIRYGSILGANSKSEAIFWITVRYHVEIDYFM